VTVASAVLAVGVASSQSARAAEIQCAPRPSDPVGYQVTAVRADAVTPPSATPTIAVLDSGVAPAPEFGTRLLPGYNALSGSNDTSDSLGHGTAVASVAAAVAGGVRGISPTSPILPIRILDPHGDAQLDWVVKGIRRAVSSGARVINLSAAAPATGGNRAATRALQDEIFRAVTKGTIVIAPTGNEGASRLDVPAALPHVIAVGATDESNARAAFSNHGAGIDLAAPGSNIYAAAPTSICPSGFSLVNGTSFAAPAVAGAAALLLQQHPDLDTTQLTSMLDLHRATAPAWSAQTGFGVLDVPAVLAAPAPPPDAPEVDDTIAWAERHPAVLPRSKRTRTLQAHVASHSDPADVFRIALKKGDRITASVSPKLKVSVRSVAKTLASGSGKARAKAPKAGQYYVTVMASKTPIADTQYSLTLKRG
jgi:subtilisin family serine protease